MASKEIDDGLSLYGMYDILDMYQQKRNHDAHRGIISAIEDKIIETFYNI